MSCCDFRVGTVFDATGQRYVTRFGLTDAGGEILGSGVACDLSPELAALSDALEKANALGLYQDSLVVAGQALYAANSIMSPSNCSLVKSQLRVVAAQIEGLVIKNTPPDQRPGLLEQLLVWVRGLPSWALPVAGASLGGLVLLSTTGGLLMRRGSKSKRGRR